MQNPYNNSEDSRRKLSILTTPPSVYSIPRWLVYALGLVGVIYILNPTLGVFELLPDNLPFIGNLDEGVAFLFIWASLVEFFEGDKYRSKDEPTAPPAGPQTGPPPEPPSAPDEPA